MQKYTFWTKTSSLTIRWQKTPFSGAVSGSLGEKVIVIYFLLEIYILSWTELNFLYAKLIFTIYFIVMKVYQGVLIIV